MIATPCFIPFEKLTVNIDLLGGDDGDSMEGPGADHRTNQTPLSAAWLELQDLSGVVGVVLIITSP